MDAHRNYTVTPPLKMGLGRLVYTTRLNGGIDGNGTDETFDDIPTKGSPQVYRIAGLLRPSESCPGGSYILQPTNNLDEGRFGREAECIAHLPYKIGDFCTGISDVGTPEKTGQLLVHVSDTRSKKELYEVKRIQLDSMWNHIFKRMSYEVKQELLIVKSPRTKVDWWNHAECVCFKTEAAEGLRLAWQKTLVIILTVHVHNAPDRLGKVLLAGDLTVPSEEEMKRAQAGSNSRRLTTDRENREQPKCTSASERIASVFKGHFGHELDNDMVNRSNLRREKTPEKVDLSTSNTSPSPRASQETPDLWESTYGMATVFP